MRRLLAPILVWAALTWCAPPGGAAPAPDAGLPETGGEGVEAEEVGLGPVFLVSLGGKLYDDIWTVLGSAPPDGVNPALKDVLADKPYETWRCVTCHGWDYTGAEIGGRRFPGLTKLAGQDPDAVKAKLLDPAHPFPLTRVAPLAQDLLALFVSQGQYDRSAFYDSKGQSLGDAEGGQAIFEGACINCHQLDGRRFLRGETGDRSSLGWVVRNRPEQALHKILNGVPGAEMLSLRFLSDAQIDDLLAYLQALDQDER